MTSGEISLPRPFSLGLTLLCGQCFRWNPPNDQGWFEGVAGQAYWRLKQQGDRLLFECSQDSIQDLTSPQWLARYLDLEDGLEAWARSYDGHPVMDKPLKVLSGLRVIRQEPWECLISYMFAQGLSLKVIQQALRKFCVEYGRSIEGAPGFYTFPEAGAIARLTPDFLRPFTNNYRA